MRNILQPVVRLLASVPSVIYGLLGVLVIVPFIGNHLITEPQKASVAGVISLSGYSLLAAVLILTVMIAPIMVSIFCDGLRAVRPGWIEGSLALGVNRWRTIWKIAVRTARPAIVAGTVLATARALGEAVMLAMVSGSVGFAPEPRRRPDLLLRALAAAGADDHQEHRRPRLAAGQRDPVRDRRGAAVLGRDVLARRLGRQAADAEVRAMLTETATAPPPPSRRRRRSTSAAAVERERHLAPRATASASRSAGRSGLLFCAIAVGDRRLPAGPGDQVPAPAMLWSRRPTAGFSESETGGFSDAADRDR